MAMRKRGKKGRRTRRTRARNRALSLVELLALDPVSRVLWSSGSGGYFTQSGTIGLSSEIPSGSPSGVPSPGGGGATPAPAPRSPTPSPRPSPPGEFRPVIP